MTGKRIDIEVSTLGKSFVIFILLLILSFVLGLYLGRESNKGMPAPDSDSSHDEQLTACSYKLQELTGKLTVLSALAKEKGLVDHNGVAARDIVCAVPAKTAPQEPAQKDITPPDAGNIAKKVEPPKAETPKIVETPKPAKTAPCKLALQLFADRDREKAIAVQEKLKIKPTRLVEGVVNGMTWYRIRYGCYADKAAAETGIEELMKFGARPILVNE
ncbi:MAG TPA: SPOR domain-containing protein [bacterium]|nr:SPOR domain-containing protein [bacterium]